MNKRKQKQLRRIMAAKRAEKCGQIDLKNLQAQVWDLAVQSQQTASWVKTQGETHRLLYRYFSKEIARLEKRRTPELILLAMASGFLGGAVVGYVLWLLAIL
ncbi:hypothetical protein AO053_02250 [Haemophilus influenzae biotype aegyptius]|uniref:hypothetical protein n=1 Tax=Haemophilus influenzae TaxID=727 RepID=UPI0001F36DD6|nr:hypothetical protein [Haemophilus influenzae]QEQ61697.1 hypothetical protein F1539_04570 [Haemophilus influenzae biotype aegyptius]QEQ64495.1 hypothetical protein F1538_09885 [Haemophilus influenzae biotype aegyptius]QEQ65481.1 hypothetical protein F1537_05200 [Haemophilus influenzae biotype aegyptius]TMQ37262.1 hypothetical protein AO051_07050 [Haemophilus influenzae biotype aegyptius]TMQ38311.1 hypothetical protein AO052_06630 [Haemophilus influenzae biotype aegyptius]